MIGTKRVPHYRYGGRAVTGPRRGERALVSARANLREGDMDGAVNRAYYAMFNIARAALLRSGVPESELPRAHNGLRVSFFAFIMVRLSRTCRRCAAARSSR